MSSAIQRHQARAAAHLAACHSALPDGLVAMISPFVRLVPFPDRRGGNLDNPIAKGGFVGAFRLPGVHASRTGPDFGHAASGKPYAVNGIDFWRCEGDRFTENRVLVDMVHQFGQISIALLAKVNDWEKK